jgi:hypothetical protein
MSLSWSRSLARIAVVAGIIAGCGSDKEGREGTGRAHQSQRAPVIAQPAKATTESRCNIGGRPNYFVPGRDDGPFAIIGCAPLGASGKLIEFSADYEHIGGNDHVCITPPTAVMVSSVPTSPPPARAIPCRDGSTSSTSGSPTRACVTMGS